MSLPVCDENECDRPANTVHLRGRDIRGPDFDGEGVAFFCDDHGGEDDRYWLWITDKSECAFSDDPASIWRHIERKRWGPYFLFWLRLFHPGTYLCKQRDL